MYKSQKGEIATFISIATLIGLLVFTFVASNIVTSKKETTSSKAAQSCEPAQWDEYDNAYCANGANGYDENYQCCINTNDETVYQDPNESTQTPSDPTATTDTSDPTYHDQYNTNSQIPNSPVESTCIGSCISDSCYLSDMEYANGDCGDGVSSCCQPKQALDYQANQDETVQQDFACEDASLNCNVPGDECNGNIVGYCHLGGWGTCCQLYSVEPSQEPVQEEDQSQNTTQDVTTQTCGDLGGECLYDGWGGSIDENVYEKMTGSCGFTDVFESCYHKKDVATTTEEQNVTIEPSPESTNNDENPVIKINNQDIPEGQSISYEGLNINASLEPGAEESYHYDESNPADIQLSSEGNGIYNFECEKGISLSATTSEEYDLLDNDGNVVSSGYNFSNVCQ